MTKWTDFFQVEPVGSDSLWADDRRYAIKDATGKQIGEYKDRKYAVKQAKYKFKKMQAKIERLLLK